MPVRLQTPYLVLRELVAADLEAVHAYASDPEVVRYLPFGPNSREETARVLEGMIHSQTVEPRDRFALAIVPKDVGSVVGVAGLRVTNREQREGHIGYALQRRHWNRGYATAASAALLHLGFETLGLHRIQTTVSVANPASKRVLEKVGMRREGYLVEHLRIQGVWMDSLLFAILDRQWRARAPGA